MRSGHRDIAVTSARRAAADARSAGRCANLVGGRAAGSRRPGCAASCRGSAAQWSAGRGGGRCSWLRRGARRRSATAAGRAHRDATPRCATSCGCPPRAGRTAHWPAWVPAPVRDTLVDHGVRAPWTHQVRRRRAGPRRTGRRGGDRHRVRQVAGLPAAGAHRARRRPPRHRPVPLADQGVGRRPAARAAPSSTSPTCGPPRSTATPRLDERDWARRHGRWVFSNPDMLHRSRAAPARPLGDVPAPAALRRHRRMPHLPRACSARTSRCCCGGCCGSARATAPRPTLVLASATVAEPGRVRVAPHRPPGRRGERGRVAAAQAAPSRCGSRRCCPSSIGENGAPVRRPAGAEAARMLADLVVEGARTLAFVRSRRGAEVTALSAQRLLADVDPELVDRVAAYRGGYLPEERRALEAALARRRPARRGDDQRPRAGRGHRGPRRRGGGGLPGHPGLVLAAGGPRRAGPRRGPRRARRPRRPDGHLPRAPPRRAARRPRGGLRARPRPTPTCWRPQLACAAAELPLTDADVAEVFGGTGAEAVLDELVADGVLRRRPTGWFWPSTRERPAGTVDIRGSGLGQVAVVEADTGRMLGTVDAASAPATVHTGAVYLHRGESYLVQDLDLDAGVALVQRRRPRTGAPTPARRPTSRSSGVLTSRDLGPVRVAFGEVTVTSQVVAYQRRAPDGTVLETVPLDLPEQTLRTRGGLVRRRRGRPRRRRGATSPGCPGRCTPPSTPPSASCRCSRSATAGTSAACRPRCTRTPAARRSSCTTATPAAPGSPSAGHEVLPRWLAATRAAIAGCECRTGCPSCVQSPKCGNGNAPLDKAGRRAGARRRAARVRQ